MSNSMKERLARAICRANCPLSMSEDAIECQVENGWDMWLGEAEAVLREMLVGLSPKAKLAGALAITLKHMKAKANYDAFLDAWQAAIQAAIDE